MLNDRAREIYAFIQKFRREHGSMPTIREIGHQFDIHSTNGVRYYLNALVKAGYIQRKGKVARGIAMKTDDRASGIPVLGRVAAGQPILAEENMSDTLEMSTVFGETEGLFALKVRGDSMIDAGILEGDFVIVHKQEEARAGQIIVALIEDEATVKYYRPRKTHIELEAANEKYEPIVVDRDAAFRILGTVRGVLRTT